MPPKLRVLVLFGGRSAEHEISLLSARFVVASLDAQRFEPLLVGIDKNGRWLLQSAGVLAAQSSDPRELRLADGPQVILEPWPAANGQATLQVAGGKPLAVDVVFPVLHGPMGEDGTVQGLFELASLPFVGAGTLGSAVGMDKDVMKRLLAQAGLPLLPHAVLRKADYRQGAPTALRQVASLHYPLFVKPACMGSSVGVSRVREPSELATAIEEAFNYDDKLVIEQGLEQPREIECAVLGSQSPLVSVPGEIVVQHPDGFYSYAAKYLDDGAITRIPADLSPDETQRVQDLTRLTFQVLECSGMARVDMFLSRERQLFVNEINTIPGCTAISMYPKMMAASGVTGTDLVSRLIDDALTRGQARRQLRTSR